MEKQPHDEDHLPRLPQRPPGGVAERIKNCTKYSDNSGGGSDNASYVTATTQKIFLLAEFEVHGTRYYANSAERNYQKQYDY